MEVHFSPETETRLRAAANQQGKDASQLVEEAVNRLLTYEVDFIRAVEEGRDSAAKGDLIDHDEVVRRIEQTLRS
jgi:predicted transcriptional regulator